MWLEERDMSLMLRTDRSMREVVRVPPTVLRTEQPTGMPERCADAEVLPETR